MSFPGPPYLLLTVDVEENMPGWRPAASHDVSNVRALPRLAELCRRLGIRPTWLLTHPVATQPESAAVMRDLAAVGDCELGTHLHPWNTPPFGDLPGAPGTCEKSHAYYIRQLEPARFHEKLLSLHGAVAGLRGGSAPTSFRAGRFGIDGPSLGVLAELGYQIDSSVTPLVDHSEDGGPDLRDAPQIPYRPSRHDPTRRGNLPLLEVPVSIGLTRGMPGALRRAYARIPRRARLRGLLSKDYLRIVDFAWLYPGRFDLKLMTRAAATLVAGGSPVLNVFLHSSELWPGGAPSVPNEQSVEVVFTRLERLLSWCLKKFDARPATLSEVVPPLQTWLAPTLEPAHPHPPTSTSNPGMVSLVSEPSRPPGAT